MRWCCRRGAKAWGASWSRRSPGRAVIGARGGGIGASVVDGENGLFVPSNDAGALAAALVNVLSNAELAERLGPAARLARNSGTQRRPNTRRVFERSLNALIRPSPPVKILIVSRSRLRFPLDESTRRKFEALDDIASCACSQPRKARPRRRVTTRSGWCARCAHACWTASSSTRRWCASPRSCAEFESTRCSCRARTTCPPCSLHGRPSGAKRASSPTLHGDWPQSARLYGSRLRKVAAPLADVLARIGIRRADAVRTLSPFTTELVRDEGVEPVAEFLCSSTSTSSATDCASHSRRVLRCLRRRARGVQGVDARGRVAARGAARAGRGAAAGRSGQSLSIVEQLLADLPRQTRWHPAFARASLRRSSTTQRRSCCRHDRKACRES